MKNIRTILFSALALLSAGFVSCTEEEFQPGPVEDGAQVYFPDTVPTQYDIEDNVSSVTIPVKRMSTEGELTVSVLADLTQIETSAQSLFTVPESVTFSDGQADGSVVISFTRDALTDGTDYPINLLLNDADNTTSYGHSQLTITITPWPWELIGTGKYRDDFLTVYTGVQPIEVDVNIHRHKTQEGVYMLEEPFGWSLLTEALGGTQEELSEQFSYTPTNITVQLVDNNPAQVYIPLQFTGITENVNGYGAHNIGTLASSSGTPAYGTLSEGVITFPTNALGLQFAGINQTLQANGNGMFRIVLPGYEARDYSLAASYSGMRIASDNTTASAVFDFTYGADVTGISYVFASGDITADPSAVIASVADDTAENIYEVENFVQGGETVSVEADLQPGVYTLVALPADASGALRADDAAVHQFYFPGAGATEDHPCDVSTELFWISSRPEFADDVADNPDYSTLGFAVNGSELRSAKYLMATTAVFNEYDESEWPALVEANGYDLGSDAITAINSGQTYMSYFRNLSSNTSYTIVILATNVYGESGIASSDYSTDAMPYSGELVIGNYSMTCQPEGASQPFVNEFEVMATPGSETEFLVRNLGIKNMASWYATYDPEALTLTLNGVESGYEDYGNQFGSPYGYFDAERTQVYGLYSYATENSDGSDPCVFSVDAGTKQLKALTTTLEVPVLNSSNGSYLGSAGYYEAGTATVYLDAQSASASAVAKPSYVSFINMGQIHSIQEGSRSLAGKIKTVKAADFTRSSASSPVTVSVRTGVCDPLPKDPGTRYRVRTVAEAAPSVLK